MPPREPKPDDGAGARARDVVERVRSARPRMAGEIEERELEGVVVRPRRRAARVRFAVAMMLYLLLCSISQGSCYRPNGKK